ASPRIRTWPPAPAATAYPLRTRGRGRSHVRHTAGEFPRHFLGRFLDAFLLALPLRAAQAVDLRLLALDADVPLHQVDLVRRDIQAVALRVLQVQIVTFRAVQQDADHAAVDADAVVDVEHQVAGGE